MSWILLLMLGAQNPVHWTSAAATRSGAIITAHVSGSIDAGWHVYALSQASGGPVAMRITLAPGQPYSLAGDIVGPTPKTDYDANFDMTVDEYDGQMTFGIPLRAVAGAAASDSVALRVRYQACNAQLCLPPRTETVAVPLSAAKR